MTSDIDTADRLTRKRAQASILLAILFIAQQGSWMTHAATGDATRFKLGAWFALTGVLLLFLGLGGGFFRRRAVRDLMNDETTRAHRTRAFALAFWNVMATGMVLYVLSLFKAFDPRDAIHVMMTVGIATALISFGTMERRALA